MKTKIDNKGMTLIELLTAISILALIMGLGVPGFKTIIQKTEINNALRTVTNVINTARYMAIEENRSIKLTVRDNHFFLSHKRNDQWLPVKEFDPGKNVQISINTSPVFYAEGHIVPLCSIYVESKYEHYRITISMAGRIKVTPL